MEILKQLSKESRLILETRFSPIEIHQWLQRNRPSLGSLSPHTILSSRDASKIKKLDALIVYLYGFQSQKVKS